MGPIYLIAAFTAGFLIHDPGAWKFAIVSMGFTFLSHALQSANRKWTQAPGEVAAIASIVAGALAGFSLLVH
jgi:hypothetical protein